MNKIHKNVNGINNFRPQFRKVIGEKGDDKQGDKLREKERERLKDFMILDHVMWRLRTSMICS